MTVDSHSFVVLAYGESPYLSQCLNSLKNQAVPRGNAPSRVLVATSTPNDHIFHVSAQYDCDVSVNPMRGAGIVADWNFGLHLASTPYVTLAHQDDIYDREYSREFLSAAKDHQRALICFSDYTELTSTGERTHSLMLAIKRAILWCFFMRGCSLAGKFWKTRLFSFGSPVPAPSVMYNMAMLGSFEFSDSYSINMDWEAWLRLARQDGEIVYVKRKLLQHRIHEGSETSRGLGDMRRQNEDLQLFRSLWPNPLAKLLAWGYKLSYVSNKSG